MYLSIVIVIQKLLYAAIQLSIVIVFQKLPHVQIYYIIAFHKRHITHFLRNSVVFRR